MPQVVEEVDTEMQTEILVVAEGAVVLMLEATPEPVVLGLIVMGIPAAHLALIHPGVEVEQGRQEPVVVIPAVNKAEKVVTIDIMTYKLALI